MTITRRSSRFELRAAYERDQKWDAQEESTEDDVDDAAFMAKYDRRALIIELMAMRQTLAVARFVAEHWRDSYLERLDDRRTQWAIGTHPLALVLGALGGETNPRELGLPESARPGLARASYLGTLAP